MARDATGIGSLGGEVGQDARCRGNTGSDARLPTPAHLFPKGVHQVSVEEEVDPRVHATVEAVEQHQDRHRHVCKDTNQGLGCCKWLIWDGWNCIIGKDKLSKHTGRRD